MRTTLSSRRAMAARADGGADPTTPGPRASAAPGRMSDQHFAVAGHRAAPGEHELALRTAHEDIRQVLGVQEHDVRAGAHDQVVVRTPDEGPAAARGHLDR